MAEQSPIAMLSDPQSGFIEKAAMDFLRKASINRLVGIPAALGLAGFLALVFIPAGEFDRSTLHDFLFSITFLVWGVASAAVILRAETPSFMGHLQGPEAVIWGYVAMGICMGLAAFPFFVRIFS